MKYKEFKDYIEDEKNTLSALDLNVLLLWKAHKRIIGYAIRHANDEIDTDKWREVYGILIGNVKKEKKNTIIIKDAIPMVVGGRAGVKFENKQYVDMAKIDSSVYERSIRDKKNEFIIGWWHTHPGFSFFFSGVDTLTQLGYQLPNPFAVGLIFDHTRLADDTLGIRALRLKNPQRGTQSTYDYIDLNFENSKVQVHNKIIKKILSGNDDIKKIIDYLKDKVAFKGFNQLRKQFGLIPYDESQEGKPINLDDTTQYIWELNKGKETKFPPFREKLERDLKKFTEELLILRSKEEMESFKKKQEKYSKFIQEKLNESQELCNKIINDFRSHYKKIEPFWNFLDTEERNTINVIQNRINLYKKLLREYLKKAEIQI
ncbi:MAG: Mov34/MPN/PAD-1 family protein [Candidatus Lokiarchaeota archaeon]